MTEKTIPWALREGVLKIGDAKIGCAVLDNGKRVLSQQGFLKALGRSRTAKGGEGASVDEGAPFLRAKNLKPFISNDLSTSTRPITYKPLKGGYTPQSGVLPIAFGFDAEAFPKVLEVYAKAKKAGVLHATQKKIAEFAERMLAALPKVAMVSLVDEATGYQDDRTHDELQRLLEAYVLPEHRPWIETIPREFTRELYRVYGWNTSTQRGPRYAGKLIRRYLYEALPAPVLPELDRINPVDKSKSYHARKRKHHSHLTKVIGLPHFQAQLAGVMALLRASPNKRVFESLFQRAYGKQIAEAQQQFAFMKDLVDLPDMPD